MAEKKGPKGSATRKSAGKKKGVAGGKKGAKKGSGGGESPLLGLAPDELPLTERRARFLAERSGVELEKLEGEKLSDVHDLLKWKIDPWLLLFRRICGQVVKKDPVTGEFHPVPNATVHVEDTDCSFWGFFPVESPWVWLYPLSCSREEIATVTTDECGEFCVYLPYWDVDRILRLRRKRICYLDFFRPRLRDLPELLPDPPILRDPRPVPDPRPLPDPPPYRRIDPGALERIGDFVEPELVEKVALAMDLERSGGGSGKLQELLDRPAFPRNVPPPLPMEVPLNGPSEDELAEAMAFDLESEDLQDFDPRRFIGPFYRCRDIVVPVWERILDVPDITFRVTQDYDLDGVEETIYSEGFFDVRWNAPSLSGVVLEASGDALAVEHCRPVEIPCTDQPSIQSAGYLDLEPAYHDDATGYGVRVNRPTAHGWHPTNDTRVSPAHAPYAGNLNLHGCFRMDGATHYRVTRSHRPSPSDPWGPEIPIKGVTWNAPRQGPGAPVPFAPDSDGWYEIQPSSILVHPNWIIPWRTWMSPGDGGYQLRLELGKLSGGTMSVVDTSAPRTFEVDNSRPEASFLEVRWRDASITGAWTDANSTVVLPTPTPDSCPVIHRPADTDIHLRVVWSAWAKHFRDASLGQSGCGGGGMELMEDPDPTMPPPIAEYYRHWHTGPGDFGVSQTNIFVLRETRPPGCYTIRIHANSRAYNPQDWNAASTLDWWLDDVVRHRHVSRAISVVDE